MQKDEEEDPKCRRMRRAGGWCWRMIKNAGYGDVHQNKAFSQFPKCPVNWIASDSTIPYDGLSNSHSCCVVPDFNIPCDFQTKTGYSRVEGEEGRRAGRVDKISPWRIHKLKCRELASTWTAQLVSFDSGRFACIGFAFHSITLNSSQFAVHSTFHIAVYTPFPVHASFQATHVICSLHFKAFLWHLMVCG